MHFTASVFGASLEFRVGKHGPESRRRLLYKAPQNLALTVASRLSVPRKHGANAIHRANPSACSGRTGVVCWQLLLRLHCSDTAVEDKRGGG